MIFDFWKPAEETCLTFCEWFVENLLYALSILDFKFCTLLEKAWFSRRNLEMRASIFSLFDWFSIVDWSEDVPPSNCYLWLNDTSSCLTTGFYLLVDYDSKFGDGFVGSSFSIYSYLCVLNASGSYWAFDKFKWKTGFAAICNLCD